MNKKGNINQLFPAVLAIILVGALLAVGIMVISSFQDTTYLNTAANVVNETLGRASTAGITLATGANARNGACGSIVQMLNSTSGNVNIELTDIIQTGCIVKNATAWNYTATIRYSYPYTFDNATLVTNTLGSTNTSLSGLASTWIPIIIVVIAAGIVLSILLGAFAGKKK